MQPDLWLSNAVSRFFAGRLREEKSMNISKQSSRTRPWLMTAIMGVSLIQLQTLSRADYSIQVGAFAKHDNAVRFARQIEDLGFPVTLKPLERHPTHLTRVLVGPYADQSAAEKIHAELLAMGQAGFAISTASTTLDSRVTHEPQPITQHIAADDTRDTASDPASFDDLFLDDPDDASGSPATQQGEEDLPLSGDELFGTSEMFGTSELSKKPGFQGFIQSEMAYTYQSPTHWSKFRNILELAATGRLDNDVSWKLSARGAYDAVFDLTDHYPDRVEDNRRFDAILYENYMDISRGDFDFRLGRQNIIWGEMVGLFFADVVSAKDLRQFVAQDFDLIRIPQWAVRAEHFKGDFHTEAIWIPFMTYNQIGKPGDDFYPIQDFSAPPGFTTEIRTNDQPTRDPSNSAYGLRFSFLKAGWDISTFYYRSVDADPAFFREIQTGPTPKIIITPKNKKIHQAAATLAKDFGPLVVKSEIIFTKDRRVNVDDLNNSDGVVKQDILDYVVGLEHTTPDNTLLNFQLFQRWYTDHDSDILFDEFETGVGLYTEMEISNKLEAELLLISQLNRTDWMARPRLNWTLGGHWLLQAGVDIFGGDSIGVFSRFDNSDRVYGNVRYTF